MSTFSDYKKQVEEWKLTYGIPVPPRVSYNPTQISALRICKKCKKSKDKMNRHHKCNDYMFALLRPDLYAARYIMFHIDDWDYLCSRCHKNYHNWARPKMRVIWNEINKYRALGLAINKQLCDKLKAKIYTWYQAWLIKPLPKMKNA